MSERISVWKIPTDILTVVLFCVSGLPKEDLVNVTRLGKCQDWCQNVCQGNTDSYTDSLVCLDYLKRI